MSAETEKAAAINVGVGLRDKFAMAALTGVLATTPTNDILVTAAINIGIDPDGAQASDIIASVAYHHADAMMKARK